MESFPPPASIKMAPISFLAKLVPKPFCVTEIRLPVLSRITEMLSLSSAPVSEDRPAIINVRPTIIPPTGMDTGATASVVAREVIVWDVVFRDSFAAFTNWLSAPPTSATLRAPVSSMDRK